jgi:hypothetical protein
MATFLIGQPGPHFKPAASAVTDGARSPIRARLIHLVTLTGGVSPTSQHPSCQTDACRYDRLWVGNRDRWREPDRAEGDSLRGAMTS